VAKVVTSDTTDYTVYPGPTAANADQLRGKFGLYVKRHLAAPEAALPFLHASIRITPRDQAAWEATLRDFLDDDRGPAVNEPPLPERQKVDSYGNVYVTLGAGPGGGVDTSIFCGGTLQANRNRKSDRYIPPIDYRAVWAQADLPEDSGIYSTILERAQYFILNSNNIFNYDCIPELATSYNSNSFVSGLLDAAGLL
jgi:hypothetical protein